MSDDVVEDFLAHYGVKGMRWGVRKSDRPAGVPARTNRAARKDATEFARAKMFYGEGAGTRRKLIKAKVESNSKRDPQYKKAFDFHMDRQDLGKRASQARSERKRKDVKNSVAKNARGAINIARGNSRYAPALLVGAVAVAGAGRKAGVDKMIASKAKTTLKQAQKAYRNRSGQSAEAWLKSNGWG